MEEFRKDIEKEFGPMTFGKMLESHRKCEELTQTELASRSKELPPQTLPEPCVRFSPHTAPETLFPQGSSLVFKVGLGFTKSFDPFAPLPLQKFHHYYKSISPILWHRYSDSYKLILLGFLPYHPDDGSQSSVKRPVLDSCHLCTGCHLDSHQASSKFIPKERLILWF